MSQSQENVWQELTELADWVIKAQKQILGTMTHSLDESAAPIDTSQILKAFAEDYLRNPFKWQSMQQNWYSEQLALWTKMTGDPSSSLEVPTLDRRFQAPEWQEPYFLWLSQSYLINSRFLGSLTQTADLPQQEKRKADFLLRQWIEAASPANFGWSNPEALKLAQQTHGESLVKGLENLRKDLPKGMVSMIDENAFEVGRNIAITPGAVVFENELIQLIQYSPMTPTVHQRPLLMVPPFINKFYILDLQPYNSLVRFAVEQDHTVFMVSWRNADLSIANATWDDYVNLGVIEAIKVIRRITKVKQIDGLGFCVGGTLMATAQAVLLAQRKKYLASLTLMATMLDFSDTGDLSIFIDEAYVKLREKRASESSLVKARELSATFASLRPTDLIWNYVVNNYLKGQTPKPFDLLFWNNDGTNIPSNMFAWYVRHTYLENKLREPNALKVCGKPLDLSKIIIPTYIVATSEDHIVPWKTAFNSTQILKGPIRFTLSASGHIAGIINPASKNQRQYWTDGPLSSDAQSWLAGAKECSGSWWNDWNQWMEQQGQKKVSARLTLGSPEYPVIEPAPGRYCKVLAEHLISTDSNNHEMNQSNIQKET